MCQSTENKPVNNTRAAMGSGMKCPIGPKVAKTAARMGGIDVNKDVVSVKESDGSWMTAMNGIKRRVIM